MEIITKNNIKKYSTYKNSGVEWLGEIPEHWDLERLGSILNPVSSKNHPNKILLSITREKGVIVRDIENEDTNHNFIPDDLTGYKLLKKGQFGMNKMKAWQGSYGVSDYTGIVSPAYYTFEFTKDIEPKFFHITIRSKLYVSFFGKASDGVRIGQWDLSKDRMKRIPLPIPPLSEQTKIAEFLDDKTQKIDEAIAIKTQQINLLKERKQILIHKAVTRGLDTNVKLKNSGVEWIGEIPVHWEVKKLKYCLNEKLKYGANESGIGYDINLPRYVRITDFGFDGKLSEKNKLSLSSKNGGDYLLKDGDILFARSGATVGKTYQFKKSMSIENNYCFAGYLIKAEVNEEIILSDFLYLFTNSEIFNKWKDSIFIKATIENIGADKYSQLYLIIPSIQEQKEILFKYEKDNNKIATAIGLKSEEIEKLKEYKSSLINSVVTGKVRVC
ncbi:restriction endonuclease subunit S [Tenacibaculum dicentrarchi]|nr:restriction endonuclease subunit S [Tenacibaculum dicentrarchi]